MDTIVGLDVVLANGKFIHATPSSYIDIFWVFSTNTTYLRPLLISKNRLFAAQQTGI